MLGVNLLSSLGTIQWNFVDLSMKLHIEGRQLLLQGLKPPKSSLDEEAILNKTPLVEGRGIGYS